MSSDPEILRIRQRLHDLEAHTQALELLSTDLRKTVDRLVREVGTLVEQDRIDKAIASAIKKQGAFALSTAQKLGAALLGSLAVAAYIVQLMQALH